MGNSQLSQLLSQLPFHKKYQSLRAVGQLGTEPPPYGGRACASQRRAHALWSDHKPSERHRPWRMWKMTKLEVEAIQPLHATCLFELGACGSDWIKSIVLSVIEEDRSSAKECRVAAADLRLVPCRYRYSSVPPGRGHHNGQRTRNGGGRLKVWRYRSATGPSSNFYRCEIGEWGVRVRRPATMAR